MDVDKLFKLPKLPSSSLNKRKWSEPTVESLKASKSQSSDSPASSSSKPPRPSVQDEDNDDDGELEEDEEFAPGNDADYFIEDDDEGGRFYGGGLTDTQKRILEVMNRDGGEGEDKRPEQDLSFIRKQLLKFEKCINKNQEMRVKFSDDPKKFIQSESDLNSNLEELLILTTNPSLYYPELIKNGTTISLCGLLSHENADISGKVIELLEELTDEDVLDNGEDGEKEDEDGEGKGKGTAGMQVLVDGLLENQLLELLIQNLSRFNDQLPTSSSSSSKPTATELSDLESDSKSIYHLLGLIENLLSFKPELSLKIIESELGFLNWILKRIERKDENLTTGVGFDQNKAYAAEILAIICGKQDSKVMDKIGKNGGIERLLGVLAQYRKKTPKSSEELEFLQNLFDILCSLLSIPKNKSIFISEEGIELIIILMKPNPSSSSSRNSSVPIQLGSIKVLDHLLSSINSISIKASEKFIQELGLKPLFKIFMGSYSNATEKKNRYFLGELIRNREDDEHILGILNSLFNCLESESQERFRLIGKFVEKDYEKCDRILELREENRNRLNGVEIEIQKEKEELLEEFESITTEEEELFYLRRLENGLFSIQLIDYILAWLIMDDDGIMNHVKLLLERKTKKGQGAFDEIIEVLKEYYENMGDEIFESQEESYQMKQKDIIVELVNYLLGL